MLAGNLLLLPLLFGGCSFIERLNNDEQVAAVGSSCLYKSDLKDLLPAGMSKEDSLYYTRQFVKSWALKELMVLQAERYLSKEDKNVEELVNDYRKQLLIYRYENRYVEQMLDTNVSVGEMEAYYMERKDGFITGNGIVKGLLIKIHKSSPALQKVISVAKKKDDFSASELDSIIYNTAYSYDYYRNNWVDLTIVARDMDMTISQLQNDIEYGSGVIEKRDSVYVNIFRIDGFVRGGEVTPFEYNIERIRELILTKRKQNLLETLKRSILQDAINRDKLKIVDNENI